MRRRQVVMGLCFFLAGCTQQMANQPRLEPQEPSAVWSQKTSPAVATEKTVPAVAAAVPLSGADQNSVRLKRSLNAPLADSLTLRQLQRGRERFNIWCTPCHDRTGSGHGMVVQRGFSAPPSYHIDRLRQQPIEYFYTVATEGKGKMPAYGPLISGTDRRAIAAYVRALQISQYFPAEKLNAAEREQLAGGASP